jgi:ribokinase
VAAARLGGSVALLGLVGDDPTGIVVLDAVRAAGVDVGAVRRRPGGTTGAALITVTPDGENAIVVAPGANARVGRAEVDGAASAIARAAVLVLQLELRLETVGYAARVAADHGVRVLLNAAPPAAVAPALLALADPLVVNEHEAAFLLGVPEVPSGPPENHARRLLDAGPHSAVVTLGRRGAALADAAGASYVPAPAKKVVDTTGAGDAFVGALAVALARGDDLRAAVRAGTRVGSAAVTRFGAQVSRPEDMEPGPAG